MGDMEDRPMSETPNDGGPAFPMAAVIGTDDMSLRDWFAGQALTGLMMSQWGKASYGELAKKSYAAADAMLSERIREF